MVVDDQSHLSGRARMMVGETLELVHVIEVTLENEDPSLGFGAWLKPHSQRGRASGCGHSNYFSNMAGGG